jgi:hypothetical protein
VKQWRYIYSTALENKQYTRDKVKDLIKGLGFKSQNEVTQKDFDRVMALFGKGEEK